MMKELKTDEPYEVSPGCPTITFDLGNESLMLPYSSFASGIFKDSGIELIFQDWKIGIDGDALGEVWRLMQMQDLRVLGVSPENNGIQNGGCRIQRIVMEKVVEK